MATRARSARVERRGPASGWPPTRDGERLAAERAADLALLRATLVPREGAPPTYARALLEAMRARGYGGSEQDLGYLLKTAFRAHPAVKKAKRGKKGVR